MVCAADTNAATAKANRARASTAANILKRAKGVAQPAWKQFLPRLTGTRHNGVRMVNAAKAARRKQSA
tara:strand:+ start:115 stop:318 length:204 start_codon:yes stop_codon:yes gene_type:complete